MRLGFLKAVRRGEFGIVGEFVHFAEKYAMNTPAKRNNYCKEWLRLTVLLQKKHKNN